MARKLRLEYLGAIYHVLNRGDHREPFFRDDVDAAASRTRWPRPAASPPGKPTPEATLTPAWIAHRSQMGVWTHGANLLHKWKDRS